MTGEKTMYGEMFENSVRCGLWLRKHGMNSHDIVLTSCHNRQESYMPIFATFYNGAPLFYSYSGIDIGMIF